LRSRRRLDAPGASGLFYYQRRKEGGWGWPPKGKRGPNDFLGNDECYERAKELVTGIKGG